MALASVASMEITLETVVTVFQPESHAFTVMLKGNPETCCSGVPVLPDTVPELRSHPEGELEGACTVLLRPMRPGRRHESEREHEHAPGRLRTTVTLDSLMLWSAGRVETELGSLGPTASGQDHHESRGRLHSPCLRGRKRARRARCLAGAGSQAVVRWDRMRSGGPRHRPFLARSSHAESRNLRGGRAISRRSSCEIGSGPSRLRPVKLWVRAKARRKNESSVRPAANPLHRIHRNRRAADRPRAGRSTRAGASPPPSCRGRGRSAASCGRGGSLGRPGAPGHPPRGRPRAATWWSMQRDAPASPPSTASASGGERGWHRGAPARGDGLA